MIKNSYCWLLAVLKSAYLRKNNKVVIRKYNNKLIRLLDVLLDVGYISNYFVKENKIFIFLRYYRQNPVWSNLHICFSKSSDKTISRAVINQYKKDDRRSVYIISTHKGLISSLTNDFVGGKLVCIIS